VLTFSKSDTSEAAMSDDREAQTGAPLDFDRADWTGAGSGGSPDAPSAPGASLDGSTVACSSCGLPLGSHYHLLGDQMLCERCQYAIREAGPPGNALTRWIGAVALGLLAAVLGGGLWYLVTDLTGYELGLIAIVVGFLVGAAVKLGARGVGGVPYQLLAVILTYSAIVLTYVPAIATEIRNSQEFQSGFEQGAEAANSLEAETALDEDVEPLDPVVAMVIAVPIAFAAPFLMGLENLIGILIIGFALYQAWKTNTRVRLEPQGPFELGEREAPIA
jgi:hypothetical protein